MEYEQLLRWCREVMPVAIQVQLLCNEVPAVIITLVNKFIDSTNPEYNDPNFSHQGNPFNGMKGDPTNWIQDPTWSVSGFVLRRLLHVDKKRRTHPGVPVYEEE